MASQRHIAIIGAGPGGLCMGVRLRQAGFENFVLLEKGRGVGGTWYLLRHCRFDSAVRSATWDERRARWMLRLESGEVVESLILATGFSTTKYLSAIEVVGRGGRRLDDAWSDGALAYLGVTTTGFPDLFMLYGPNTNNGSILSMIEAQVDYALRQIQRIEDEDLAWIDVRREPMERYNDDIQRAIGRVAAWQADCNGYYRTPSGRIVTQWPYSMTEFRERTSKPDADAYEVAKA